MNRRLKTIPLKTESGGAFVILFVCMILSFPFRSNGQTTSDADPEISGAENILAPVKIDGKTLFLVRGIASYPASQRAATISKRIKKAAADKYYSGGFCKNHQWPGIPDDLCRGRIHNEYL